MLGVENGEKPEGSNVISSAIVETNMHVHLNCHTLLLQCFIVFTAAHT